MSYEKMTVQELQAEQTRLHGEVKQLKAARRLLSVELDRRAAIAEAEKALAGLSDDARKHVKNIIGAKGIASQTGVGTPGQS